MSSYCFWGYMMVIDWLTGWSINWFLLVSEVICWLLIDWVTDRLTCFCLLLMLYTGYWLTDWLIDWLINWFVFVFDAVYRVGQFCFLLMLYTDYWLTVWSSNRVLLASDAILCLLIDWLFNWLLRRFDWFSWLVALDSLSPIVLEYSTSSAVSA